MENYDKITLVCQSTAPSARFGESSAADRVSTRPILREAAKGPFINRSPRRRREEHLKAAAFTLLKSGEVRGLKK